MGRTDAESPTRATSNRPETPPTNRDSTETVGVRWRPPRRLRVRSLKIDTPRAAPIIRTRTGRSVGAGAVSALCLDRTPVRGLEIVCAPLPEVVALRAVAVRAGGWPAAKEQRCCMCRSYSGVARQTLGRGTDRGPGVARCARPRRPSRGRSREPRGVPLRPRFFFGPDGTNRRRLAAVGHEESSRRWRSA